MPDREFLETYPLYRKFKKDFGRIVLGKLPKPSVHMWCYECESYQTFASDVHWRDDRGALDNNIDDGVIAARYVCSGCHRAVRMFYLKFDENNTVVCKVGQDPAWEIAMDPQLGKMLGHHAGYYRKGLVCESQGYGIGAFGYYRRIVEDIIDRLLEEIAELIPEHERAQYTAALQQTKQTRVTQEKIDLVKDLLPPILRPEGMNPLAVLHSTLSEGLHAETDERCMELAETTRSVLVFLVNQVLAHKAAARSFTESMRKLLDRKAK